MQPHPSLEKGRSRETIPSMLRKISCYPEAVLLKATKVLNLGVGRITHRGLTHQPIASSAERPSNLAYGTSDTRMASSGKSISGQGLKLRTTAWHGTICNLTQGAAWLELLALQVRPEVPEAELYSRG